MAVSAYASLLSLTHVLDNLRYRAPFHLPHLDMKRIDMLQENVHFLLQFVELHSERESPEIASSLRQMAEIAFEAENMIDFHVVNELYRRSQGETSDIYYSTFSVDIAAVISTIGFIKKELSSINVEGEHVDQHGKQPVAGSFATSSSGDNVPVGIDERVVQIMEELYRDEPNLQILPIVGMGGIGKTTLAESVFDHPYTVEYFDMRIWLTISQEYSVEKILGGLLDVGGSKGTSGSLVDLGEKLYKKLFGRKYLIVMDDVWTIKAWDDLEKFFPNNRNGSRIMVTTRLSDMAACLGSCNPYLVTFLDEGKSWDLFCLSTFAQIGCPYAELEQIGKNIVESCRGLPLEMTVIGRLLANSSMTQEYWRSVSKNVSSFGNLGDNEHCLKVLSLSYKSLPIHLKPCFLYMRVFPEDAKIEVSELITKWVAEGFVKSEMGKSLEETADEYVRDLCDRNMITVNKNKGVDEYIRDQGDRKVVLFNQRKGTCGIHDLLRDLCLRESNKESFIQSPKLVFRYKFSTYSCFLCQRFIGHERSRYIHKDVLVIPLSSRAITAPACDDCETMYSFITRPTLVRAMDASLSVDFKREVKLPTAVRYASIECAGMTFSSPSVMHLLWNLQSVKIDHWSSFPTVFLPVEIWEMPQLRSLEIPEGVSLPDPVYTSNEDETFLVLKNLHTLHKVRNFKCTKEVLDRVPNLKVLLICNKDESEGDLESSNYSLYNLVQLQKLELLGVDFALEKITFPNSLKQLSLSNYQMTWEDMSTLGSLPSLERLMLFNGVEGSEWNAVEGGFRRLKELIIKSTTLVVWRADQIHFPILERLELHSLDSLEEIPSGIGDIPTLQFIGLYKCSDSAMNSAIDIREEQQSMGNESLQIHVTNEDAFGYPTTQDGDSD